jgi:CheY-like chemotaxis protein
MSEKTGKRTILLVDDDAVFVEAVSAVLESRYTIKTASNGAKALENVAQEHPDLIILDVMMDYISEGFDVARTLRQDSATKAIPIIMLTGVDQMYDYRMEVEASFVPCERYMEKPVAPEKLLTEVKSLIG